MNYADILAASPQPIASPPQGPTHPLEPVAQNVMPQANYTAMSQPNPVAEMQKPAQSPQEVEQRKAGWLQVIQGLQNNPNFMRAVGFAGAALAQPKPVGQSTLGHIGNAWMVGNSAYELGNNSANEYALRMGKDAREQAESAANVERVKAGTERERVATETARATQQATIDDAITKSKKAKLDLDKATKVEEVEAIERELIKRKATLAQQIPDAKLRAAAEAEVDLSIQKLEEAKARVGASRASARNSNASARLHESQANEYEAKVKLINEMDPEEKKAFFTKTGKYATTTSALTQQRDMWSNLYDKLPADDSAKKGKTKEQFVMGRLTEAKQKDAIELLVKAKQAGLTDEEINDLGLLDLAKASAGKRGAGGGDGSAPGVTKMIWDEKLKRYVPQLQAPKEPGAK